jgi:hypothetical protein
VKALELLTELSDRNVRLWVEGSQLRYLAPKGVLTPEHRDLLLRHKEWKKCVTNCCWSGKRRRQLTRQTRRWVICLMSRRDGHRKWERLTAKGVELSYAELNSQKNQLASYLREHGVGPGVFMAEVPIVVHACGLECPSAYYPGDTL